jgi:alpha-beta hydrolase superfamily lysophospholipase
LRTSYIAERPPRHFEQDLDLTVKIPQWIRRLWWKPGLVLVGVLVGLWLLASLAVAYRFTKRSRPPYAEPIPMVAWGAIETQRLRTQDSQEIGAWFVQGSEEAPSILLLHGNGGSRGSSLSRAAALAERGNSVMMITLRAHGDSTGDWNDFGYSARHDVIAAVGELERRRPGRPIVVFGTSLGAAAAIFASSDLSHRVGGYILECPYRDLKSAVRNRARAHLPTVVDRLAYSGLLMVAPLVIADLEKISPIDAIAGIPADVPVLILAGGADRRATPEEIRAIHRRVGSHGRLVFVAGAEHHTIPQADPDLYWRSVIDLIQAAR